MNVLEVVAKTKSGQLNPQESLADVLRKAESLTNLNIFTEIFRESARQQAIRLTDKLQKNQSVGRLAGAIFAVKDNFLLKDTKTTAAAPFLKNFVAPYSATCLQKILDEDAILLGKTNLDAFAHGTSTENSVFGPSKNPHDATLTPGGSSGGSAAAVAAGICHFALGTDTGGSIRLPASFCGIVGFKPTYGLLSRYGLVAMASSTDCVGPLTHTPGDASYLVQVLAGQDPLDSTTIDSSNLQPEVEVSKPLTLGVITEFSKDISPKVDRGLQVILQAAQRLGWQIKQISLPNIELALACYYVLVSAEISSNLSRYDGLRYGQKVGGSTYEETMSLSRQQGFMTENKRRIMLGTYVLSQGYYEAYYRKAQQLRTLLVGEFDRAFAQCDALISPTSPTPAFALGSKTDNPVQMYLADLMTVAPSLVGIPAVSLPAGSSSPPVGIQILTPQKTDYLNLAIAQKLWEAQND